MLKAQAEAMDPHLLDEDRLMIRLFAKLLRDNTTDELVDLYSEVFTPELIALFERKTWSLVDLLTLPLAENDGKVGLYLIIASRMLFLEAGYIGSATSRGGIRRRNMQHRSRINGKLRPDELLYSFVQGPGIRTHHQQRGSALIFSSFPHPPPFLYHHLNESFHQFSSIDSREESSFHLLEVVLFFSSSLSVIHIDRNPFLGGTCQYV